MATEVFTEEKFFEPESIGAKMIGVQFISGNNDALQNLKEFYARAINRTEKKRHLGENIDGANEIAILNKSVDKAQQLLFEAFIWEKNALLMNKKD